MYGSIGIGYVQSPQARQPNLRLSGPFSSVLFYILLPHRYDIAVLGHLALTVTAGMLGGASKADPSVSAPAPPTPRALGLRQPQ